MASDAWKTVQMVDSSNTTSVTKKARVNANRLNVAKPKWSTVHNEHNRANRESPFNAYDLSLEQVEWAYALSVTLTDLIHSRLMTILRLAHSMWSAVNTTIDGFSHYLIYRKRLRHWVPKRSTGCFKDWVNRSKSDLLACLEVFQQEDSERPWKAQKEPMNNRHSRWIRIWYWHWTGGGRVHLMDTRSGGTLVCYCVFKTRYAMPITIVQLMVRRQNAAQSWQRGTITKRWSSQNRHHNQPLAMLCSIGKQPPMPVIKRQSSVRMQSTLQIESTPNAFNHVINHQGLAMHWAHRNTIRRGGIDSAIKPFNPTPAFGTLVSRTVCFARKFTHNVLEYPKHRRTNIKWPETEVDSFPCIQMCMYRLLMNTINIYWAQQVHKHPSQHLNSMNTPSV